LRYNDNPFERDWTVTNFAYQIGDITDGQEYLLATISNQSSPYEFKLATTQDILKGWQLQTIADNPRYFLSHNYITIGDGGRKLVILRQESGYSIYSKELGITSILPKLHFWQGTTIYVKARH
jgi:hypothetical protein